MYINNKSDFIFRLEWLEIKEVICTLGGAWCASFVIPLDWDRPWQVNLYYLLINLHYARMLK